jgi:hypothetical protein
MLQEEKRRNDPNSVPDYLKEMQMLSPDNKLCADCGHRSAEWGKKEKKERRKKKEERKKKERRKKERRKKEERRNKN